MNISEMQKYGLKRTLRVNRVLFNSISAVKRKWTMPRAPRARESVTNDYASVRPRLRLYLDALNGRLD